MKQHLLTRTLLILGITVFIALILFVRKSSTTYSDGRMRAQENSIQTDNSIRRTNVVQSETLQRPEDSIKSLEMQPLPKSEAFASAMLEFRDPSAIDRRIALKAILAEYNLKGRTTNEIRAVLGPPHALYKQGQQWCYHLFYSSLLLIDFDANQRVTAVVQK